MVNTNYHKNSAYFKDFWANFDKFWAKKLLKIKSRGLKSAEIGL
jgi:hypothetical protein